MTSFTINRGYRQQFAILLVNTLIADCRIRITCPGGVMIRLGTVADSDGAVLALSEVADTRGASTQILVTLPAVTTRKLGEGAVNPFEIERLPLQEYLGTAVIIGSAGRNDD
jgi:hypothetical protein